MTDRDCMKFQNGKTISENLTGELDVTIIEYFEINLFSIHIILLCLVSNISYWLARTLDFLQCFVDGT